MPFTPEGIDTVLGERTFDGARVKRWGLATATQPEVRFIVDQKRFNITFYDSCASEYTGRTMGELRTAIRLAGTAITG